VILKKHGRSLDADERDFEPIESARRSRDLDRLLPRIDHPHPVDDRAGGVGIGATGDVDGMPLTALQGHFGDRHVVCAHVQDRTDLVAPSMTTRSGSPFAERSVTPGTSKTMYSAPLTSLGAVREQQGRAL